MCLLCVQGAETVGGQWIKAILKGGPQTVSISTTLPERHILGPLLRPPESETLGRAQQPALRVTPMLAEI